MLISYRWISDLLHADLGSPTRVADALTSAGLEIEGIDHVGASLRNVRVAAVVSTRPHPTSKNPLTLVTVDLGGGATVEVVCGAPNVPAPGGRVCFAPLGTTVFDRKGGSFVLEAKPIAGIVSQGMLCAEDELGLGADHDGILVLDSGAIGAALTDVLPGAEDWILHVNVTANRPDALGHLGVARDAAARLGLPFVHPAVPAVSVARAPTPESTLTVRVEDAERCPRYAASVVTDVTVGPSPLWVRTRLSRLGVRSINNVVDVTNLVMLERGQPMHAFDLACLAEHTIVVRRARPGEPIETLDGVKRTLDGDDLVIADANVPVAIAGVMGSEPSGVHAETKTVVLESAFFEPRGVRRSARRHGIHSEASHRFEREIDISAVPDALALATHLLCRLSGGAPVGAPQDHYVQPRTPVEVTLRHARITAILGVEVPPARVVGILDALGFGAKSTDAGTYVVSVPAHRPDVTREIDVIEEVGRIFGLENVPSVLPPVSGAQAGTTRDFALRRQIRVALSGAGVHEAVSYAFVSPRDLEASGFGDAPRVRMTNPMTEERSLLRPSLLPRLFAAAAHAHRFGVPNTRLFEVGTTFHLDAPDEPGLLRERTRLAVVLTGPRDGYLERTDPVDFFDAKGILENAVERLTGRRPALRPATAPLAWAHPRRAATVIVNGAPIGVVAEVHPDVRAALDLPRGAVALEIDAAPLGVREEADRVRAPGRFPTVRRDVALLVQRIHPAGDLAETLRAHAGPACESVVLFDRYQGRELPEGTHSLAYALWFRADERTLTDDEVDVWIRDAVAACVARFEARQR